MSLSLAFVKEHFVPIVVGVSGTLFILVSSVDLIVVCIKILVFLLVALVATLLG